jgi:hypothetical protein
VDTSAIVAELPLLHISCGCMQNVVDTHRGDFVVEQNQDLFQVIVELHPLTPYLIEPWPIQLFLSQP